MSNLASILVMHVSAYTIPIPIKNLATLYFEF